MKLRAEQLEAHLRKGLANIYIVSGDEPLLVQESVDAIRQHTKNAGFTERQRLSAGTGFNWHELLEQRQNLSLFSSKSIIELHMDKPKPGKAGGQVLIEYTNNIPTDKILIIITSKIDTSTQATKWLKTLEKNAQLIQIWPINRQQLPQRIGQRLQRIGLSADQQDLQLLADSTEGNLLAACQEIEKLSLSHGEGKITAEQISASHTDNARFDIFQWMENVLSGNLPRSVRIFNTLKAEAVEPVLLLWSLTRELRRLYHCAWFQQCGYNIEKYFQQERIWEKQKPLYRNAMQRHSIKNLQNLLGKSTQIDQMIKGVEKGNVWHELLNLSISIAR
jgi:DNA polymerase-3 subunit delta